MAEPLQKKLQAEVEKYQQLQKDISKCMSSRQKLEAQLTENNIVQEELGFLDAMALERRNPTAVEQPSPTMSGARRRAAFTLPLCCCCCRCVPSRSFLRCLSPPRAS
nr:prefoldin subunit 6-like isoform X2 [Anolis sagrei ordinatus]